MAFASMFYNDDWTHTSQFFVRDFFIGFYDEIVILNEAEIEQLIFTFLFLMTTDKWNKNKSARGIIYRWKTKLFNFISWNKNSKIY